MRLQHSLVICVLALGVVAAAVGPVAAEEPVPTVVAMAGAAGYADEETTLEIVLTTPDGTPVGHAEVLVQRRTDGWHDLADVETDDAGRARLDVVLSRAAAENTFRASFATGDEKHATSGSGPVLVPLVRRESTILLRDPHRGR